MRFCGREDEDGVARDRPPLGRGWANPNSTGAHSDPHSEFTQHFREHCFKCCSQEPRELVPLGPFHKQRLELSPSLSLSGARAPSCADRTGPQAWGQVSTSGIPVGSGAPERHQGHRVGSGEVRHVVGAQMPRRGFLPTPSTARLGGAWAQAEKQGCYVAMATEGSSLPRSRNHGGWGVGAGGGCFPSSTEGWGAEAGHRSPPLPPCLLPPHPGGQQPAGGVLRVPGVPRRYRPGENTGSCGVG